ncbi:MAG: HigA family addiction module antidote protein [Acidobacteriota bacterium]|nr:HigA family addiction module antidote protein [Acidobacteriota bacterium]
MLLEEFLRPAGFTQAEAARRMAIPLNRLNEIVKGKRGVTADTALRLAKLFKMSPEFWMNLQADWDLWHAAKQMRKAG